MIIEVNNLVKRYRKADTNAVDVISFAVKEGEFFTLLGPNGAGKTTAVSILSTTLMKTSGEARIAGLDVEKQASQVRRLIGVIFQNPSLDLNLTAEENVRFHACLYGIYSYRPLFSLMAKEYQQRVFELADILDIKQEIFKSIKTFSGGMRRKLEIIRSLMHHPRLLFLDEPTTGLDPESRRNLWQYLNRIRLEEHTTIFLTTHYLEEAETADHICIIDKGKIISDGTPAEIKKDLAEEYLLLDAADRGRLAQELKALGLEISDQPPFKVKTAKLPLQRIIKALSVPLTTLRVHDPTLEEAYLKIISKDNHART